MSGQRRQVPLTVQVRQVLVDAFPMPLRWAEVAERIGEPLSRVQMAGLRLKRQGLARPAARADVTHGFAWTVGE